MHFVVYEDEAGKTFVDYDTFVSLLAQYQCEEIIQVAQVVEQKLATLLTAVTKERGVRKERILWKKGGKR